MWFPWINAFSDTVSPTQRHHFMIFPFQLEFWKTFFSHYSEVLKKLISSHRKAQGLMLSNWHASIARTPMRWAFVDLQSAGMCFVMERSLGLLALRLNLLHVHSHSSYIEGYIEGGGIVQGRVKMGREWENRIGFQKGQDWWGSAYYSQSPSWSWSAEMGPCHWCHPNPTNKVRKWILLSLNYFHAC